MPPEDTIISRRAFLGGAALAVNAASQVSAAPPGKTAMPVIQTVLGPIPVKEFGFALPHEHILVDFIGAEKTGRHRWKVEEVIQTMRPYLLRAKERGITGFVDCTPAYIGRDPRILKRLAQETGLHILTNTGYYGGAKDLYLPKHAFTETPEQLAARWIREWEQGIEGTGVKPGFMKIGIDEATGTPPRLSDVDAKLVRAAARASKSTGLSVTCHTQDGPGGLAAARLFAEETATPARFIVAHSDGHGAEFNLQVAEVGAWVSFDGIGYRPTDEHLKLVTPMLEKWPDRLLLSMDSGWYWVGEPNGGKIREYSYLTDDFLPALRKRGFPDSLIRRLTVENPAKAFALSPK